MGFLFRLCFWLCVTLAIMPPDERPGEALAGVPDQASLEQRFAATIQSVWELASQVTTACEDNPQLCAATAALAQTAAETGQTLMSETKAEFAQTVSPRPKAQTPVDAPLPAENLDGRVGLGQDPAG